MQNVKKTENLFIFFLLALLLLLATFGLKLDKLDELWNFTNVYKMSNGYIIYKDCNVIVTPLFFIIGNIIFNIFGKSFLVFRIYGLLINTGIYFCIYNLFKKLNIEKKKSLLYTLLILCITNGLVFWGANYNNLAILITLIAINDFIKSKNDITQGIFIFLIFMTKQNIGVYYAIGLTIYKICSIKNIKQIICQTLKEAIISIGLLLAYIGYLFFTGNLLYFVDMVLGGVNEFADKNSFVTINSLGIIMIQILIIIFELYILNSKRILLKEKQKDDIKLLVCIATLFELIAFPIFNLAHVQLTGVLIYITFIYTIDLLIIKELKLDKKIVVMLNCILVIWFIGISVHSVKKDLFSDGIMNYNEPYYGVKVDYETQKDIEEVCEYIKENQNKGIKTIVFSSKADLYMNVLNLSNGKFDLPFIGNLGNGGENGLIDNINNLDNTYILLSKEKRTLQESEKVINYIKNNWIKKGELSGYYIYEKSKF